jgi:hypothetical protein
MIMRTPALFWTLMLLSPYVDAGEITESELNFNAYYAKVREIDGTSASAASRSASALFDASYSGLTRSKEIRSAPPEALRFLLRAAAAKSFYTQDDADVSIMRDAIDLLRASGRDSRRDWDEYYRSLILTRRFAEAAAIQADRPGWFPALPTVDESRVIAPRARTVWRVERESNALIRQPVDVSHGRYLVVTAHPACKFSRAAMLAFEADPELRTLPILWLVPPDRDLGFDLVADWNSSHPSIPLLLADRISQWDIENWSTPNFHLFVDGRMIDHRAGWAPDGTAQREMGQFIEQAD